MGQKTSELWSRRNVIATVAVGLLSCVVTATLYFVDFRTQEIGTQTTIESSESSEESSATVSISSIHLSTVALDVPAAFEMEVQVQGSSRFSAHDINVILDFGRAEIEGCGYSPKGAVRTIVEEDKSYRRLEVTELRPQEKLYIRCLLSSPVFEKVAVEGGNISIKRSIDFAQYQASLLSEPLGFWSWLGRLFVIFLLIMLCLKIIGYLFPD